MINFDAAIKEALELFDQFKLEVMKADDPAQIPDDLVKSMQQLLKQACRMLSIAGALGPTFSLASETKAHADSILLFFLNDPVGSEKLKRLSELKGWDFASYFQKLHEIIK